MKKSGVNEQMALQKLMFDNLRNFVPEFKRVVEENGEGTCTEVDYNKIVLAHFL